MRRGLPAEARWRVCRLARSRPRLRLCRDCQEVAAARAAAEQEADNEELKEALRNEEAEFAAEQASKAAAREAEGAYR